MATGDGLKSTKAVYAAVIGFVAPGAGMLLTQALGDGISSGDLLAAGLTCIVTAGASAGAVHAVENLPKPTREPADTDWMGRGRDGRP